MLHPRDVQDLVQIVGDAAASGNKLEIVGGGTRHDFGAPRDAMPVSMAALSGVIEYDPAELVLTLRGGTPLSDVLALIEGEGQMLAFEPWGADGSTIGGIVAAGVAGSRRVTAGSVRDHLLGFSAVSGRGEVIVAGAKVVKNVTGYDLPKLMAGSWGRLGAVTELTLKVLPKPRVTATMMARGVSLRSAHAAMACALGSNLEVSAAAYLQNGDLLLRIAGFAPSVEARCRVLPTVMKGHGELLLAPEDEVAHGWHQAMTGQGLSGDVCWQVHLPPRHAHDLIESLSPLDIAWAMDWGGGRVWIITGSVKEEVRVAASRFGGEARLVRAPAEMRASIPAFQPRQQGVMMLEHRVRQAFDPFGVFATDRFREDAYANQL